MTDAAGCKKDTLAHDQTTHIRIELLFPLQRLWPVLAATALDYALKVIQHLTA